MNSSRQVARLNLSHIVMVVFRLWSCVRFSSKKHETLPWEKGDSGQISRQMNTHLSSWKSRIFRDSVNFLARYLPVTGM